MPAQTGRQPAAGPSMGQTASWPAGQPTVQPGSEAILGPASQRPTARRAGLPARRAASQYQPEGRQEAIQSHNRQQPRSHFGRQYHKNSPIPGKPRKEKKSVNSPATELVDRVGSQQHPASWSWASQQVG